MVIRLRPDNSTGYVGLGQVLEKKCQFAQAGEVYRTGTEKVLNKSAVTNLKHKLEECDRRVYLDDKLGKVLSGAVEPADNAERLELAGLCVQFRKRNVAAAGLYGAACAENPQLADDLRSGHRYDAACAAALAGCGQGEDADKTDMKERAGLREQALDWLRADLQAYRQALEKVGVKASGAIAQRMQHWLRDFDLKGVRSAAALPKLPEAERQNWQKLWRDVLDMARRPGEAK